LKEAFKYFLLDSKRGQELCCTKKIYIEEGKESEEVFCERIYTSLCIGVCLSACLCIKMLEYISISFLFPEKRQLSTLECFLMEFHLVSVVCKDEYTDTDKSLDWIELLRSEKRGLKGKTIIWLNR